MREVSGVEPVVWGPSMIGFGTQPYTTADGKERSLPADKVETAVGSRLREIADRYDASAA